MATRVIKKFPCSYKYAKTGMKKMQMSNNISSINVRGALVNGIERQAVSVLLNDNITELSPSCFANCTQLTTVLNDKNIRIVGDYAFYNCSSLKTVNFVQDNNAHELCYTGNAAFMKSGLTHVNVNTKSSVSDTGYGASCFAQCTDLTSATLTGAPFLASHMFDGCTSLTQVTLADKHSYVFDYCFANCQSLTRIDMPKNMYMLASHMFDGCTNLTSITFPEDSILNYVEDHVFANCPKLTSIVLPKSINTFEYIDPEFLAGSNINKVTFKGLSDDMFVEVYEEPKELTYKTNYWYYKADDIKNVYKEARKNNIPIIAGTGLPFCSICKEVYGYETEERNDVTIMIASSIDFKGNAQINCKTVGDYLKPKNCFWLFGVMTGCRDKRGWWSTDSSSFRQIEKTFNVDSPNVVTIIYWLKEDGTEIKNVTKGEMMLGSKAANQNAWKNKFKSVLDSYPGTLTEVKIRIKSEITTFGRGAPVIYVSSTGKSYVCENNTIERKPEYRVDKYSTSNFKYGIWYYNIEQLHAFADANHIPLVLEWSSKGCEPCKDFSANTWSNSAFQEEIKSKACLFARIEATSKDHFSSSAHRQEYYASHILGNPNVLIPQLVFYWKKADGTVIKDVWNYNHRTDPANANYQTVLNKIDALIGSYTKDNWFIAPSVMKTSDGKYNYYDNQAGDNIGQFFICDVKTKVVSYNETPITIDTTAFPSGGDAPARYAYISSKTYNSITVGQTVEIPKMTYQYFNVPAGSNFPDQKGVIFKADDKYFVGDRGLYYGNDTKWHYDDTDAVVTDADFAAKTVKTAIAYIYKFENNQHTADVDIVDDRYQSGTMIPCNESTSYEAFNDIISFAGEKEKLVVIAEMANTANQDIDTKLLNVNAFKNWMKSKSYLFIKVAANAWTSNAPKALIDMENAVQFNGNTVGSGRPKLLVFKCCTSCGIGQYGAVYCKRTIAYDSSKDVSYYTKLIDDYDKLQEG